MTVSRITKGVSDIGELRNDSGRLRPTRALGVAAAWRSCLLVLAFVGLGFATSPASAAVGVDTTSTGTTLGASINISHTTSGSDRLMLVGVSIAQVSVETVSSITYNGGAQSLSPRGSINSPGGQIRVEIWSLVAPAAVTADVVVNFSSPAADGAMIGVMTFTGVDQTTPLGTFAPASANTGGSASVDVSSAVGELVFGVLGVDDVVDYNLAPGPGQTPEKWDLALNAGNGGGSTEASAAPTVATSWTWLGDDEWAVAGISIKSAAAGPLGHWEFDEGSGDTAADSSGNGNDGTLGNLAGPDAADPAWVCVAGGYALSFDGTDDIVDAGSATQLDDLGPMTIAAWIRPDAAGNSSARMIMSKSDTGSGRWFLEIDNTAPEDDAFEFNKEYDSTDLARITSNGTVAYDVWQHVVVTWDGSDTGANVHIYKDGVETGYLSTDNGSTTKLSDAALPFTIGNRGNGANPFFGVIDDVRVYDRVLSAGEISALAASAPGPCGPTIYYVRTDGNDSNSGTTNSPGGAFLTIQKAADTMVAGDKTFVVTGTYNEEVVPLNGGTAINPIVYEALGNVVLDGGNALCYGFRVENAAYTTIDGFEFTNYLDCGGGAANAYFNNSPNCQVLNNVFHDTGRDAIGFYGTTANCLAHNNLIYNMDDDGFTPAGGGNHTIRNNTIFNIGLLTGAGGWAIEGAATAGNVYENNIFWDDIDIIGGAVTYSYNDYINSVLPGTGNISTNPLFINTGTGDFHLSQIAAGQGSDSPAVDAGGVTAASLGLDTRTTRTDSVVDSGTVDMGYHYLNGISPCPGGIVTTIADTGASSLRECINYANGIPGTTITFDIPGPGNRSAGADSWWAISPATPLPPVTAPATVIDSTTQTTNQGDTNTRGPEIEIDGTSAGAGANGLVLGAASTGSTIRGLAIGNFSDNGILLLGGSNLIAGNYLGLSADGDTVAANNPSATNQLGGIRIESASNMIGGIAPADRNVISGNGFTGIELFGAGATGNQIYGNYIGVDAVGTLGRGNTQEGIDLELSGNNFIGGPVAGQRNIISGNGSDGIEIDGGDFNVVQGNYIGTDVTGTALIPNGRDGIDLNDNGGDGAMDNLIGGTGANEGNLIRGNTLYGINVRAATVDNNAILGNQIYENVLLDIDLNDDGITVNDPLDTDSGSNGLLNYPVIVAAPESGGTITVNFDLDVPAGDYRIEFFTNPSGAHASGNGGGEVFAGATTIAHAGAGVELFAHAFAGSAGDIITATATEELAGPVYNSTSEFSTAFTATALTPFTARWPLDETSGVIAFDIDAGNDGTYLNGVLLNQLGACADTGNAVYFDGVDDLVEVPHSPDYLIDEGTVTLWANIDALGPTQSMFSKDSTGFDTGGHLTISVQAGGDVQVRLQSATGNNFVNSAPITPGAWFHVAFSWGPGGMALYIDGAAPVTNPYVGGLGATSGGAGNFEPIAFGAGTISSDDFLVTPTTQFFAGYMDDVRINNRALTLPEIQTLATCTPSLDIVKRAFWPDGTPIPTGATIPSGVEFKYLLYVNNPGAAISDVTVRDVLDPVFVYQAGTIQVDNSLADCAVSTCTAGEELAIFTAADATAFLTDAADADVASYTGASLSVDAGNGNVANLQLDINANAIWAILFSVKMP